MKSYLFQIELSIPIEETEVVNLFKQIGMICLPSSEKTKSFAEYRSYYFELRTKNGLTEANMIFSPSEKHSGEFSLRFSVLSPKAIIYQTFEILSKLNASIPIKVYDTEISNHIYRQLRKDGLLTQNFEGIENTDKEKEINQRCYVPIDVAVFSANELSIHKRQLVLNNDKGEIIESGSDTIDFIEKKGQLDHFIYWVKKEL